MGKMLVESARSKTQSYPKVFITFVLKHSFCHKFHKLFVKTDIRIPFICLWPWPCDLIANVTAAETWKILSSGASPSCCSWGPQNYYQINDIDPSAGNKKCPYSPSSSQDNI